MHQNGAQPREAYAAVNKGRETPATFARRVLEDPYDRLPIMVWRPPRKN